MNRKINILCYNPITGIVYFVCDRVISVIILFLQILFSLKFLSSLSSICVILSNA